jgi:hypothetical protein
MLSAMTFEPVSLGFGLCVLDYIVTSNHVHLSHLCLIITVGGENLLSLVASHNHVIENARGK